MVIFLIYKMIYDIQNIITKTSKRRKNVIVFNSAVGLQNTRFYYLTRMRSTACSWPPWCWAAQISEASKAGFCYLQSLFCSLISFYETECNILYSFKNILCLTSSSCFNVIYVGIQILNENQILQSCHKYDISSKKANGRGNAMNNTSLD